MSLKILVYACQSGRLLSCMECISWDWDVLTGICICLCMPKKTKPKVG